MTYSHHAAATNLSNAICRSALVAAVFAGLGLQPVFAKDGDVDTGFGDMGHRVIQFDLGNGNSDFASAIAVDNGGRIVVSGTANSQDFVTAAAVARLDAGGNFDSTFGFNSSGKLHLSGPDGVPAGSAGISMLADGAFCLVGNAYDTAASLTRGLTVCVGSQFSSHSAELAGEPLSWAASTAPDEDGGFFVAGTAGQQNDADIYVARLMVTAAGIEPDPSFYSGTGEIRMLSLKPDAAHAAIRVVGGVYVAGEAYVGINPAFLATDHDFRLVAVGDNGSSHYDLVSFDLPSSNHDDRAVAVSVDIAGRILLAGTATADADGANREIAIARLLSPSSDDLDLAFGPGANGKRIYNFDPTQPEKDDALSGMVVDGAGRIYLVGTLYHGDGAANPSDIAVMRLTPDGDPDPSFGVGGTKLLPAPPTSTGSERGVAIAMQDHRPVILGEFDAVGSDTGFVVYRLESTVPPLFANGFE
jgi:uncharacterized delta-60 repeat protein